MNPVLLSAESPHHATPKALYEQLDAEFCFDFDPCPYDENWQGPLFNFDGLYASWSGKRVFCNPPYGKGTEKWLAKACEAELAVFLLPARTDTKWWHEYAMKADEIRFVRGRLRFGDAKAGAPFPSVILIYRGGIPMPLPSEHPAAEYGLAERELAMRKPNWAVSVENWRELGEAIATFNSAIGSFSFIGTAAMTVEDRIVKLEITLLHEMGECTAFDSGLKCGTPICDTCNGIPF